MVTVYGEFFGVSSPHEVSVGFISLHAKRHFHLKGNCRRGSRCTYAHSWAERIEWTCPICTVDGKLDCDQKWQHILKYRRVGVYTVLDGRTVGEFLKSHVT